MYAVRYHGCTCHRKQTHNSRSNYSYPNQDGSDDEYEIDRENQIALEGEPIEDSSMKTFQNPWYFHLLASLILMVHGITFLVPHEPNDDDTDMLRAIGTWFGFEMSWAKPFTPYGQGLASVFNFSLGIVSWWIPKDSERYTRLVQLRVFAFCVNILHAYITGPAIYQNGEDLANFIPNKGLTITSRVIGLFRLSYLTPGLMCAGVTEVMVDKEEKPMVKKNKLTNAKKLTHSNRKDDDRRRK